MGWKGASLNAVLCALAAFAVLVGFKGYHDFVELREHLSEEWSSNEIWYASECVGAKEKALPHEPSEVARHRLRECDRVRHGLTMGATEKAFYAVANSTLSWGGEVVRSGAMRVLGEVEHPIRLALLTMGAGSLAILALLAKRMVTELLPAINYKIDSLPFVKKKSE